MTIAAWPPLVLVAGANGVLDFVGGTVGVRESERAEHIKTRKFSAIGARKTIHKRKRSDRLWLASIITVTW